MKSIVGFLPCLCFSMLLKADHSGSSLLRTYSSFFFLSIMSYFYFNIHFYNSLQIFSLSPLWPCPTPCTRPPSELFSWMQPLNLPSPAPLFLCLLCCERAVFSLRSEVVPGMNGKRLKGPISTLCEDVVGSVLWDSTFFQTLESEW